ncbi:MAG: long-chain fatty acid--CoA ligase [Rhodospirillaceae bacterium]
MNETRTTAPNHPWLAHYPEGVAWQAPLPVQTLTEAFDTAVATFANHRCLDFMDKHYTYREVGRQVAYLAEGLQKLGLGKGDHVGLFLPNTPYYVIAYFAILRIGATVVNFNPLYVERELIHQIDDSGTSIMITLDLAVLYDKLAPLLGRTALKRIVVCRMADCLPFPKSMLFPVVKRAEIAHHIPHDSAHLSYGSLTANFGRPKPVAIDAETDVAVLQYTGGTTGTPKGAMLTHANLTTNARQCVLWFPKARPGEERMLAVLPFFHVFAMTVALNAALMLGAEILLVPRFELDDLLDLIDQKKPTLFPAVPTIFSAINNHPECADHDLTSIRFCISGGAPLPGEVRRQFEAHTGCIVIEGYGLSESSPVACITPIAGASQPDSVGLPVPGTVIEIVSLTDDEVVLPPGERGEVCIRGPQVMKGYWNRPEDTARTLKGGRLHTGDIGIMDANGFTAIVDRIKDLIIAGGFNVYPRTVEEAIYLHPEVEEVVVAGIPDAYRGQTVKAYIKRAGDSALDETGLLAFLKDKLSPIEMPKKIEFRDSLPRTLIGKLSRKDLLEEERLKTAGEDALS